MNFPFIVWQFFFGRTMKVFLLISWTWLFTVYFAFNCGLNISGRKFRVLTGKFGGIFDQFENFYWFKRKLRKKRFCTIYGFAIIFSREEIVCFVIFQRNSKLNGIRCLIYGFYINHSILAKKNCNIFDVGAG